MKQKRFLTACLAFTMLFLSGCHAGEAFTVPPSKDLDKYESKEAAYEAVWGDMVDYYGEYLDGELSFEQQSMINYPAVDRSKVYWIDSGVHYHSITWCYSLEGDIEDTEDDDIQHGSTSKAVIEGMTACSICCGTDPLPRLRKALFGDAKQRNGEDEEEE